MVSRKCPACGAEWYSANTFTPWVCQKCGCGIPNEDSPYNGHNEQEGGKANFISIQILECQIVVHCPKYNCNICVTYYHGTACCKECEYYEGFIDNSRQIICNYTDGKEKLTRR